MKPRQAIAIVREMANVLPPGPERDATLTVLDLVTGRAPMTSTDGGLDESPPGVLRQRVLFAERRIADLLVSIDLEHGSGCSCVGECVLAADWVPEPVRRAAVPR